MKTYRTLDGEQLTVTTSRDLVRQLRAGSRDRGATQDDFMRDVAGRAFTQTGVQVPTHSEAAFVAALVQAGLLTEVN